MNICSLRSVGVPCAHEHHVESDDSKRVEQSHEHSFGRSLVVNVVRIDEAETLLYVQEAYRSTSAHENEQATCENKDSEGKYHE